MHKKLKDRLIFTGTWTQNLIPIEIRKYKETLVVQI